MNNLLNIGAESPKEFNFSTQVNIQTQINSKAENNSIAFEDIFSTKKDAVINSNTKTENQKLNNNNTIQANNKNNNSNINEKKDFENKLDDIQENLKKTNLGDDIGPNEDLNNNSIVYEKNSNTYTSSEVSSPNDNEKIREIITHEKISHSEDFSQFKDIENKSNFVRIDIFYLELYRSISEINRNIANFTGNKGLSNNFLFSGYKNFPLIELDSNKFVNSNLTNEIKDYTNYYPLTQFINENNKQILPYNQFNFYYLKIEINYDDIQNFNTSKNYNLTDSNLKYFYDDKLDYSILNANKTDNLTLDLFSEINVLLDNIKKEINKNSIKDDNIKLIDTIFNLTQLALNFINNIQNENKDNKIFNLIENDSNEIFFDYNLKIASLERNYSFNGYDKNNADLFLKFINIFSNRWTNFNENMIDIQNINEKIVKFNELIKNNWNAIKDDFLSNINETNNIFFNIMNSNISNKTNSKFQNFININLSNENSIDINNLINKNNDLKEFLFIIKDLNKLKANEFSNLNLNTSDSINELSIMKNLKKEINLLFENIENFKNLLNSEKNIANFTENFLKNDKLYIKNTIIKINDLSDENKYTLNNIKDILFTDFNSSINKDLIINYLGLNDNYVNNSDINNLINNNKQLTKENFFEFIKEKYFLNITPGNKKTVLYLNPPELGKVKVDLNISKKNEIKALFTIEHPEIKDIIEKGFESLKLSLEGKGYNITQFAVKQSDNGQSLLFDNFTKNENNQSNTNNKEKNNNKSKKTQVESIEFKPNIKSNNSSISLII